MASRHLTPLVIAAAVTGWLASVFMGEVGWLGDVMAILKTGFLSALKLIIGPLVFFSLISGLLSLENARRFRALGTRTLLYYLGTTATAICIGLLIVYFLHPWTSQPPAFAGTPLPEATLIDQADASTTGLFGAIVERAFVNPVSAFAELNILGIVANALLFGLAMLFVLPVDSAIIKGVHDLTQVIYRVTGWVINVLPLGVLAIAFEFAGSLSTELLTQLLGFAAVVLGATLVHGLIVLPFAAWVWGGQTPKTLFAGIAQPLIVALTTSSSSATLPVSIQAAQDRLGVSPSVASFVLPLGATMNMDGTALFEGIAAVFLAYLFGIPLDAGTTLVIFLMAMLASIGAPGIPSGSMAGMQMVMLAVGIPLEALGILLLIERPLDTFRTAVNVEGDLVGCVVVEGRQT
jgi:Na+/H+-dicarboxylate symporter